MLSEHLQDSTVGMINKLIPDKHMPEIIFITDVHENFINGLVSLALKERTGNLKVIRDNLRGDCN